MSCYFNDGIGGITFIALSNIFLSNVDKALYKLWQISIFLFGCGIFWEYITPLYRKDTVSDPRDIIAYMIGGLIYWVIIYLYRRKSSSNDIFNSTES